MFVVQARELEAQLLGLLDEAGLAHPQGDPQCTPMPALGLPTACYTDKRLEEQVVAGSEATCEDPITIGKGAKCARCGAWSACWRWMPMPVLVPGAGLA